MVREDIDLEALLDRCAAGDESAFKALFDAEAARMKGIAMRVLHRSDMAEEAVQEAFLQIWRNARRYDRALGSPRAWMFTIVRFRAIDLLRSRPQEDALPPEELDRLREAAVDHAWDGLDREGRLAGCLAAIEAAPRRSLLLSYVVGLTQEEIAGRLGRPLGTVKSWMRRALLSLRECLG
ncbi:sigma-70 family RNA polymerase sigma factor [uncultured Albimonas sp.]|uniref:sigma-70 family RNA polymerase sigma factor n=1 Tax=uncultured Albimonas sp. TaxID=1331701 RepID=UPI0030EB6838|tara:strand:- start:150 stop:689 length:540 start_codon:yes stop_codon:yes gene_type:complete